MGKIEDWLRRAIEPLHNRILLMVGRAVIRATEDGKRLQELQVEITKGELRSGVQFLSQYGIASRVHLPDAAGDPEAVVVAVGGNRDHLMAIASEDRRHRPKGKLQPGEVILYDSVGTTVHFQQGKLLRVEVANAEEAGEIQVIAGTVNVDCDNADVNAQEKVAVVAPLTTVSGDLEVDGDVTVLKGGTPFTMSGLRSTYNAHTHPENDNGGPTDAPNQTI